MKCENCKALRVEGYEYPETYCCIGADEIYANEDDDGCTLHGNSINARIRKRDNAEAEAYEGIGEYFAEMKYNEKNNCDVSNPNGAYVRNAMHCIGLDYRKSYIRHGKKFYKPYRNYFNASPCDTIWHALTSIGYAEEYEKDFFCLTRVGIKWLGNILKIRIREEEK